MLRRSSLLSMRLCVILPRVLPKTPYCPITQVVSNFNSQYRAALGIICSACSRGHEVQAVLVGPDPPNDDAFLDLLPEEKASASASSQYKHKNSNDVDPVIRHLLDAYGKEGSFKVALATSPNQHDPESLFQEPFVELRSDLFGSTHWVTTINSLVTPGNHCVIDGIGPEVAGALKYALGDPRYSQAMTDRGIPVSWSNRDFPTAEGLIKSLSQIYASHKMVASLSTTEARMKRAPESSVIPPTVRDASRAHLPRELSYSSPEEAKDASKTQDVEMEFEAESRFKDFPQELLILSLNSWRQLDIAEWFRKRVIALPKYDGGEESEMCIAAVEDTYAYFQEMFRQKSFSDYSFLCIPPKVALPYASASCESGQEVRSHYQTRSSEPLELTSEVLPFNVFRGLGIFEEKYLSRLLGWGMMNSDCMGYTVPLSSDMIGDTIVTQLELYVDADYQVTNTLFHFRGSEEEKRAKAKKDGALKLGSHIRLTMGLPMGEEDLQANPEIPRYWNPLFLNKEAKKLEAQYTRVKWLMTNNKSDEDEDED